MTSVVVAASSTKSRSLPPVEPVRVRAAVMPVRAPPVVTGPGRQRRGAEGSGVRAVDGEGVVARPQPDEQVLEEGVGDAGCRHVQAGDRRGGEHTGVVVEVAGVVDTQNIDSGLRPVGVSAVHDESSLYAVHGAAAVGPGRVGGADGRLAPDADEVIAGARVDVVADGDVADRDPVATAEGVDRDLLDAAVVDRHEVSGGTRGGLTDIAATGDDLDDEVLTLAGAVDDELVAAGAVGDRDPGSGRPEQRHADRVGSVERRQ